jgi:hypothetical protein
MQVIKVESLPATRRRGVFRAGKNWESQLRVMFGSGHWTLPDSRGFAASEMLAFGGLAAAAIALLALLVQKYKY